MNVCVFDTDVVIAALDRSDAHHTRAAELVERLTDEEGASALVSTVNYAEALVRPAASEDTLDLAVDAIAALGLVPVKPSASVARDAARIRARKVSLPDGFALATAIEHRGSIASFDQRVRRAADALGIEIADWG